MLANDIETDPGPLNNVIVTMADFHQGSAQFLQNMASDASQCMACSLVSIAYSFSVNPSQWSKNDLHDILYLGDFMYHKILPFRANKNSQYLDVMDLPQYFSMHNSHFSHMPQNSFVGTMGNITTEHYCTLDTALNMAFVKCRFSIMVIQGYGISIFKYNNSFFVFDPHSRNNQGMCSADGSSVLIQLQSFDSLLQFIRELTQSLTQQEMNNVFFDITPIKITKLERRQTINHVKQLWPPTYISIEGTSTAAQLRMFTDTLGSNQQATLNAKLFNSLKTNPTST
jgi:hypothetical protein